MDCACACSLLESPMVSAKANMDSDGNSVEKDNDFIACSSLFRTYSCWRIFYLAHRLKISQSNRSRPFLPLLVSTFVIFLTMLTA